MVFWLSTVTSGEILLEQNFGFICQEAEGLIFFFFIDNISVIDHIMPTVNKNLPPAEKWEESLDKMNMFQCTEAQIRSLALFS